MPRRASRRCWRRERASLIPGGSLIAGALRFTKLGISKKRPRRAERLSRQLGDGEGRLPLGHTGGAVCPRVRLLPSNGRDPFCGSPQIALRHPQLGIGVEARTSARKGERHPSFVCATTFGRGRRCVGSARRDLRHCGRRRQERHSISTATPSSIITMTPSPMIPSLVGRFMIKPSMEKRGEANLRNGRPGEQSRAFAAFKRATKKEVLSRRGPLKAQVERWPIVLAMRNWGFYLAVVAAAPIDRRVGRTRRSIPFGPHNAHNDHEDSDPDKVSDYESCKRGSSPTIGNGSALSTQFVAERAVRSRGPRLHVRRPIQSGNGVYYLRLAEGVAGTQQSAFRPAACWRSASVMADRPTLRPTSRRPPAYLQSADLALPRPRIAGVAACRHAAPQRPKIDRGRPLARSAAGY